MSERLQLKLPRKKDILSTLNCPLQPAEEDGVYCRWEHLGSRTLLCQAPLSYSMITILLYYLVSFCSFFFCTSVTSQIFTCAILLYTTVSNKYSYFTKIKNKTHFLILAGNAIYTIWLGGYCPSHIWQNVIPGNIRIFFFMK